MSILSNVLMTCRLSTTFDPDNIHVCPCWQLVIVSGKLSFSGEMVVTPMSNEYLNSIDNFFSSFTSKYSSSFNVLLDKTTPLPMPLQAKVDDLTHSFQLYCGS